MKSGIIHLFYCYLKNVDKIVAAIEKEIAIMKRPYEHYLESEKPI